MIKSENHSCDPVEYERHAKVEINFNIQEIHIEGGAREDGIHWESHITTNFESFLNLMAKLEAAKSAIFDFQLQGGLVH